MTAFALALAIFAALGLSPSTASPGGPHGLRPGGVHGTASTDPADAAPGGRRARPANSAPTRHAVGRDASSGWRWPLGPPTPTVVRAFSPPAVPWGPGHRGVDLAARPGAPVRAAGAGTVSYAGRLAGRSVVAVSHGVLRTTYLPVLPSVRVGAAVAAGTPIGVLERVPSPHCAVPCLHWGLLRGTVYLDPLSLVGRGVRLLPQWATASSAPHVPGTARRTPDVALRSATSFSGTWLTGMGSGFLLAFLALFVGRHARLRRPARRRQPCEVIDLARERRLRRVR
ncbi:murein hydrolase activator EnvC family protein [Actinomadura atramentaria]|uniref:murein hydrolase activator EnvC family protein n=1 Tax=Actinomadura atramentaria TaxID=1990 RepID=UPI001969CD00|nr:M23 family metallopeptidase [Actinomadura atramentaria]